MMNRTITLISRFDKQVMLKQSLFGLPWLFVTILLAYALEPAFPFSTGTLLFVLGAFVGARTAGMCLNRLIDRHIDAENPRTRLRPLPKGEVSVTATALQAAFFSTLFFICLWQLPPLCIWLGSIGALFISLYSHMKRISVLCHFVLGLIHGLMPSCVWVALSGTLSFVPIFLGGALFCSIAASDIIYACQDIEFDRERDLKSIPAKWGSKKAFIAAKLLHSASFLFLVLVALKAAAILLAAACAVGIIFLLAYRKETEAHIFHFANSFSGFAYLLVLGALWPKL